MPRVPRNESSAERPARGRAGRTTMRRVGGTAAGQQKPHAATTHQVEEGQNRRGHRALSAVLCQRHGRTRAGESLRGRFAGGRDAAVLELVRHGRAAQPRSRPVPLNAHDKAATRSAHDNATKQRRGLAKRWQKVGQREGRSQPAVTVNIRVPTWTDAPLSFRRFAARAWSRHRRRRRHRPSPCLAKGTTPAAVKGRCFFVAGRTRPA